MQGGWIVEMGELQGLAHSDVEVVKKFTSATSDHVRLAYPLCQGSCPPHYFSSISRECPVFCVTGIWSMLPERSKDDDNFQGTAGRTAEGLRAT